MWIAAKKRNNGIKSYQNEVIKRHQNAQQPFI
jgi:hypothetical protein